MLFPSSVHDTELVLYPLQDKLTFGDKSLDLYAFKLFFLFFSLLSLGSSSCWRSYRLSESIAITHRIHRLLLWLRLHSLRTALLNTRVFLVDSVSEYIRVMSFFKEMLDPIEEQSIEGGEALGSTAINIWDNEDVDDLGSVETEFLAIVFNDTLTSEATLSCEPTVSSLNDEIDLRISFDESDDEDCTVIFDKNSLSYKIIYVNNLKTDSENANDKVNMPLFPSPEPMVSYFDDLDYFKDFENKFPAIVYNDAQTSKLDDLDYFKDFEK
ncbi:hypothetical protein Tco_0091675 [Tanacetum coccineum]